MRPYIPCSDPTVRALAHSIARGSEPMQRRRWRSARRSRRRRWCSRAQVFRPCPLPQRQQRRIEKRERTEHFFNFNIELLEFKSLRFSAILNSRANLLAVPPLPLKVHTRIDLTVLSVAQDVQQGAYGDLEPSERRGRGLSSKGHHTDAAASIVAFENWLSALSAAMQIPACQEMTCTSKLRSNRTN